MDMIEILSEKRDFEDILSQFLSPSACAKEGSLYDSLYDALDNKDDDCAVFVLMLAGYLRSGTLMAFLTHSLRPARAEGQHLLERLYSDRRADLLEILLKNTVLRDNRELIDNIDRLIREIRHADRSPLPPYDQIINRPRYNDPHEEKRLSRIDRLHSRFYGPRF